MFPEVASLADFTPELAQEFKRRRAEGTSAWTVKGDLGVLRAIFGKWLGRECGLLDPGANPFANVKPPKCDDPDVRIVSRAETEALFAWLSDRWNGWKLPLVYLEICCLLGWRATELASIRDEDLLADGFVRVQAETCKTRKHKIGWLPEELYVDLAACQAGGWAFGRFSDELRRLLMLWKRQPNHAARVQGFSPERLVGWLQDELKRFNEDVAGFASLFGITWEPFTLHDFRRTAITGMQMAGVSEKETSVMVGATPEIIRRHYEKLDQLTIAKRNVQRRLGAEGRATIRMPQSLRTGCARGEIDALDTSIELPETAIA
jgi:integrase